MVSAESTTKDKIKKIADETGMVAAAGSSSSIRYSWLSNIFASEIAVEAVREYRSGHGRRLLDRLGEITDFAPEIDKIQKVFGTAGDTRACVLNLSCAYASLFLGAGGAASAPPYESVFTSPQGVMFQAAEADCRRVYEQNGLQVAATLTEPADHLAVQLDFMVHLSAKMEKGGAADAIKACLSLKRKFMQDHLLNWLPAFTDRCEAFDPSGYYAAAARLSLNMIRQDFNDSFERRKDG